MQICDKCGQGTSKSKMINSKKTGQSYVVFECTSGCRNGKWAYTFFPKELNEAQPQTKPVQQTQAKPNGDAVLYLKEINTTLKNILQILQTKTRQFPIQDSELQPDDTIPF